MTTRIAIVGAAGRMGKTLVESATDPSNQIKLTAAVEHPQCPDIGQDVGLVAGLGELGVAISNNLGSVINDFDVLIDFQDLDEIAKSIFEKNRQYLAIPAQMSVGASDNTDFSYAQHAMNKALCRI